MKQETPRLIEGEDFYREGTNIVFTALYHLRRGQCCGSGCRHCPYDEEGGARAKVTTAEGKVSAAVEAEKVRCGTTREACDE